MAVGLVVLDFALLVVLDFALLVVLDFALLVVVDFARDDLRLFADVVLGLLGVLMVEELHFRMLK